VTVVPVHGAEVAHYSGPAHAPARQSLDEQWRFAQALSDAGLLPEAYRKNPPNVLLAMQKAEQHGIHLMTALEGFTPIKGKLFMEAATMRALIQGAGHRFDVVEQTRERCVIESQRRGEDTVFRDEYDIEDARLGGLLSNDNYRKHPKRMLLARCTSQAGNAHFSDVLKGTAYTPEDFGLTGGELSESAVTAAVSDTPRAAAILAAPTVGTDIADDISDEIIETIDRAASTDDLNAIAARIVAAEGAGRIDGAAARVLRVAMTRRAGELPAGKRALTKMHAALGELGLTADREQKLLAVSNVVGRPVGSTSELTGAEADTVWRRAAEAKDDGGAAALLFVDGQDDTAPADAAPFEEDIPDDVGVSPEEQAAYAAGEL
jgi:hypothetical protein